MSIINRKSSRKYKTKKSGIPEKPISRFNPGAGVPLKVKPTLKKKAES